MNITHRIIEIMNHYKLSPTEFSEKLGVQRSSISHLTSGRNKPSLDFIEKLLFHFPELNLEWFVSGKGSMLKIENIEKGKEKNQVPGNERNTSTTLLLFPDLLEEETPLPPSSSPTDDSLEKKKEEPLKTTDNFSEKLHDKKQEATSSPLLSAYLGTTKKVLKKIILIYEDDSFEFYTHTI